MTRSTCPWCGRDVAVRMDGRLAVHHDLENAGRRLAGGVRCAGVGRVAAEHDPAVDRPREWPVRPFIHMPRVALWKRDGGRCWICGARVKKRGDWHADHVIPASAAEDAVRAAGLAHHPGDSWTNFAVACLDCNMDKGHRWGRREVDKHRELAALYPEGYCITLRFASGIRDHTHVPDICVDWEMCLGCNRDRPDRQRCSDCTERIAYITVDLSSMTTHRSD